MKAVVYMMTRNFYEKAVPSIKSMLLCGNVDKIYALIEDDTYPFDLPVEAINVSNQTWFRRNGPNYSGTRFSWIVMMRTALHRIFPDLDRILSIDADTIILDDLSPLWELPIEDYYFAAVREPLKSAGGSPSYYFQDLYVNVGVSLMNLRKLRDGMGDRIMESVNSRKWKFVEQDSMNHFCNGKICQMPSGYNVTPWTEPATRPKVIHYAAIRDWYSKPLVQAFKRMEV